MDAITALRSRRSCRHFLPDDIDAGVLATVLGAARTAPSAGNTWALDLVVLQGSDQTGAYWDVTLPRGPRRDAFRWPGLLRAPVLVLAVVDPSAYVRRYGEPDKAASGLGDGLEAWAVPYWWVDAGAAVMAMLVAAEAAGLGALLFGQFEHEAAVGATFGIPADRHPVGTIALGHPDVAGGASASASVRRRPRPSLEEIVHPGGWSVRTGGGP